MVTNKVCAFSISDSQEISDSWLHFFCQRLIPFDFLELSYSFRFHFLVSFPWYFYYCLLYFYLISLLTKWFKSLYRYRPHNRKHGHGGSESRCLIMSRSSVDIYVISHNVLSLRLESRELRRHCRSSGQPETEPLSVIIWSVIC